MWISHPFYLILLLIIPVFWKFSLPHKELIPPQKFYLLNGLRSLIIILLILALSGLKLPLKMFNELNLIFVTDHSNSISPSSKEWVRNYMLRTLKAMKGRDKIGWISFGTKAYLEQKPVAKSEALKKIGNKKSWDKPGEEFTNIEAALSLSLAMIPDDAIGRIVLFSDGNENAGKALSTTALARTKGVKIYPILPPQQRPREILLEKIILPERVMIGEAFNLKINIANLGLAPCPARLKISKNDHLLLNTTLTLSPGLNYFGRSDMLIKPGGYKYTASIETACDTNNRNNQIMGQVTAAGKPKILCIDGHKGSGSFLGKALKLKNVDIVIGGSQHIPKQLSQLAKFDALVLNNVSRSKLTDQQMEMIKDYVGDMGGGFVMIGGENSFSAGDYAGTPIEKILPVTMGQNISYKFKQILLVLLIDISSSMAGEKISLARKAASRVEKQLRDNDMLGIILFDSHDHTVVDLQLLYNNRNKIKKKIQSISTGRGGTNIYPALQKAYQMLKSPGGHAKAPMQVKHIILLSDGKTYGGNFEKLAADIARDRITASSIAIGPEADVKLLSKISQIGKGLFHHPKDVTKLPQVFITDIESAISKSAFVEKPVYPNVTTNNLALKGIKQNQLPPLRGYMVTTPKPGSRLELTSDTRGIEDPILSTWRYGMGKTVAYTSDVDGRWSSKWIGWDGFSRFWSQVIRFAMKRRVEVPLDFSARRIPEGGIIEIALLSPDIIVDELEATAWGPDGKRQPLELTRTGMGKYQAKLKTSQFGLYMVNVKGRQQGKILNLKTGGVIISPSSEEYRQLRTNQRLLKQLATISQGEYNPERNDIFLTPPAEVYKPYDMWQALVVLALLLFVVDVAIRRLWL